MEIIYLSLTTIIIVVVCIVIRLREPRIEKVRFVKSTEESNVLDERREKTIPKMWLGYNDEYVIERRPADMVAYRDSYGRLKYHEVRGGMKIKLSEPKRCYESGTYEVHALKENITFQGYMCKDQQTIVEK